MNKMFEIYSKIIQQVEGKGMGEGEGEIKQIGPMLTVVKAGGWVHGSS